MLAPHCISRIIILALAGKQRLINKRKTYLCRFQWNATRQMIYIKYI